MDPPRKFEDKIVNEKLAVFTFDDKITEPSLRKYFVKNWNDLTVEMNKSTILFMGGIHGKETGEFGAAVDIQTLENPGPFLRGLFTKSDEKMRAFVSTSCSKLLVPD